MNGFLNIYKPRGITSNNVVMFLKRLLYPVKIGHTGTLDPMAEGVLVIALGEATKAIQFTEHKRKTYEFNLVFGTKTDTGDADGKITQTLDKFPTLEEIKKILPKFIGKIRQIPPKYSALKINGKNAYELAREGVEFELKERLVEVWKLGILENWKIKKNENLNSKFPNLQISKPLKSPNPLPHAGEGIISQIPNIYLFATVSRGTYIRTLAEDIAESLGCLGHIDYLKRTKDGAFEADKAIKIPTDFVKPSTLERGEERRGVDFNNHANSNLFNCNNKLLTSNYKNEHLQDLKNLCINHLTEIDAMLDDIPVLHLKNSDFLKLKNGQVIEILGLSDGNYKVYNEAGVLQLIANSQVGRIKTVRGFNL